MDTFEDAPFICLSPGEADAILAQLDGNPGEQPDLGHLSGTEDNPVVIDGEEDDHQLSCTTLRQINSAVGVGTPTPKEVYSSLFHPGPSGKRLRRPPQLVALEKKLRLRLPKGPFKFTPQLIEVLPPGTPTSFGLGCPSGSNSEPTPLPSIGRVAREGEEKPHPLVFPPPLLPPGEQGEDEPHLSPTPSSLPWIGEQGEDEPHLSPSIPILTRDRISGEGEEKPHPPAIRPPLVPLIGLGADEPHHPFLPSVLPSLGNSQTSCARGHPESIRGKRRRTRRAGRKYQVRKLLREYYLPTPPPHAGFTFKRDNNNKPTKGIDSAVRPVAKQGPRVIDNKRYTGPPIKVVDLRKPKWVLTPITVKVVYRANIPPEDPRYNIYIRKRAEALYPLPSL